MVETQVPLVVRSEETVLQVPVSAGADSTLHGIPALVQVSVTTFVVPTPGLPLMSRGVLGMERIVQRMACEPGTAPDVGGGTAAIDGISGR